MFKCEETLDLAFDPTRVERSNVNGRYYVTSADDESAWRWLTPTEASEYSVWERDYQRASDDGMPEAQPAADLGVDWGKVAEQPNGTMTLAKGSEVNDAVLDELYGKAALMLSESRQDPVNKRFALLIFDMKDVDAETTEGSIDTVRLAGSAGDEMVEDYIRGRHLEAILNQIDRISAKELEI